MTPRILAALLVFCAPFASAQGSAESFFYWAAENVDSQRLIERKAMPTIGQGRNTGEIDALCWVAPAADWALETKDPAKEKGFLEILRLVAALDAVQAGGNNRAHCDIKELPRVSMPALDLAFEKHCVGSSGKDARPAHHMRKAAPELKFVSRMTTGGGKITAETMIRPSVVIQKSLAALARSENEETAIGAVTAMRRFEAPAFFPKAAKLIAINDASRTERTRAAALETWTILEPSIDTAKTIFRVAVNTGEPDLVRKAALGGFSYIAYWTPPGSRGALSMVAVPDPQRPEAVADKPPVCVIRTLLEHSTLAVTAKCGYGAARALLPPGQLKDLEHVDADIKRYCDSI